MSSLPMWMKAFSFTADVVAASSVPQLDVLVKGLFEKERFLQYLRYFVVFEEETKGVPIKKLAGYHQFYAVNVAVEETVRASRTKRCLNSVLAER